MHIDNSVFHKLLTTTAVNNHFSSIEDIEATPFTTNHSDVAVEKVTQLEVKEQQSLAATNHNTTHGDLKVATDVCS